MKKTAAMILLSTLIATQSGQAVFAESSIDTSNTVQLTLEGSIYANIPIENGHSFIPLRAVMQDVSLQDNSLSIEWETNKAIVTLVGKKAVFQVGNLNAVVDGKNIELVEAPYISSDEKLYIPATALSTVYGKDVKWDEKSRTVVVNTSNADKATAVLKSLESGNPEALRKFVDEGYIQHNLTLPTGRDVIIGALPQLKAAGTTVKPVRVLVDGDYVAVHSEYNFGGPKAGFDIFRFENGKIVEHWDNLQTLAANNPSDHSMLDGQNNVTDLDKTEENKAFVKGFVENILMGKKPALLTSYFNGDNYIQHNPSIADGLLGLGAALQAMAQQGIEMKYDQIHKVIGQGNIVLVVSEGTFAGQHTSYYDLFRVENGKIAEHWDVLESIPTQDNHVNQNGKF